MSEKNLEKWLQHPVFTTDTHFLVADSARLRALHVEIVRSDCFKDFIQAFDMFQHFEQAGHYLYQDPTARTFMYHPFVMALAETAPIDPGRPVVLYSSRPAENKILAQQYVLDNPGTQIIDNSVAGWMLDKLGVFDKIPDAELAYQPWFVLSRRFCTETTSPNVVAFYQGSDSTSTFRMVEIEAMLENSHIKTVNGECKTSLVPEISDDYTAYLLERPSLFGQKLAAYRAGAGERGLKASYIPIFRQ